ncbi:MAG: hypothetical protein E2576_02815 [Alcaligenaceae bacterium]|nr:hypothetical protein [Alcaligenaceae bacterium SAGV5]MPS50607.1 hypothetical protein [Alcaligenaceae bacterium SAGV3]MPT55633.1 hypothetical protein [Alcaligenaceae bacterium]
MNLHHTHASPVIANAPREAAEPSTVTAQARLAVRILSVPPSPVLLQAARGEPGERVSLELHDMRRGEEVLPGPSSAPAADVRLGEILRTYLETEKNRVVDREKLLAFVKEQRRQLALPEAARDWTRARRLYLDVFGVDDQAMKRVVGGHFSGGWVGSGSLYALTGHLMTLASLVPSIYMMTVSADRLAAAPVSHARANLGAQASILLATPFVNSALYIVLAARQELMRAIGQSGRCAEMDAPAYETTRGDIEALMPRMEASTETMLAHQRELRRLEPGGAEWCARKARMERDGDEALALVGQFAELDNRFQVRKGVINLNYTSQQRQAFTRALRVMVNLAAQVGAVAAHSPPVGYYVQVGGTLAAMGLHQFWAAPEDQRRKQDDTLMATIATTRLLKEAARDKPVDALRTDDLGSLDDLPRQWKGPISVALGQFKESLELERAYAEQTLADILEMDVTGFRRLQALREKQESEEALSSQEQEELASLRGSARRIGPGDGQAYESLSAAGERLDMARHELACIKEDDWLALSPDSKRLLLDAVGNDRPWLLSLRTAWVRMRVPAEVIPHIAQRVGSQFAMLVGGGSTPLVVSALIRYLNAVNAEAGKEPMVAPQARYWTGAGLAVIGLFGAFSAGAATNTKIWQRAGMRKAPSRVGFQLGQTTAALKAIGQAMVSLPSAVWQRGAVEYRVRRGGALAGRLRDACDGARRLAAE